MDRDLYRRRYHEALSKAFSARATNVRAAYFDLANFYREKLGHTGPIFPTSEDLQTCLARRRGDPGSEIRAAA